MANPLKFSSSSDTTAYGSGVTAGYATFNMFYLLDEARMRLSVDSFDNGKMYQFEDTKVTTVWAWLGWLSYMFQWDTDKRAALGVTAFTA